MLTPRPTLTRRIVSALDASPSRIPVVVGGCGSGRTTLVRQIGDRIGRGPTLSIDVERTATTPERFRGALAAASPLPVGETPASGARAAFDATLDFFNRARTAGGEPITFVLDEFLEFRTFESFPGLRRVLHELIDGMALSGNRFVLTSRYVVRTLRLLRDRSARFEVIHMPGLTVEDALDIVLTASAADAGDAESTARTVLALADGRPSYVRALVHELAAMRAHRGGDPMSALTALLVPDGPLSTLCRFCYELRLHRARGYGALKAILDILGEEEGLTLTEIALRLRRTPGSTKDYLSWLEDVDLVTAQQKRYSYTDPLLRVWVRLHCRATAPSEDDLVREVHRYARPRLPPQEPALAMASSGSSASGIIEID
jgi:hypothetical protein